MELMIKPRLDNLFDRAIRAILPWNVSGYPGVRRGAFELLSGRLTMDSIGQIKNGRRRAPAYAARILATYLEQRATRDAALAAELSAYADAYVDKRVQHCRNMSHKYHRHAL